MSDKITWKMILADFKKHHPSLANQVVYWCPYGFLTIMIYVKDGRKMTYDYFYHKAKILKSSWLYDPNKE